MAIKITRYALVDGVPMKEETNWATLADGVSPNDSRAVNIGDHGPCILASHGYTFCNASDLAMSQLIKVEFETDEGGIGVRYEGNIPHDSAYWRFFDLPLMKGVKLISQNQYDKLTEKKV